MPQVSRCTHCNKKVQVPDRLIGKQVKCPGCKQGFQAVPVSAKAREPAAVAAPAGGPPPAAAAAPAPTSQETLEMFAPSSGLATTAGTVTECPACKATLLPGAVSCMDCGFLIQGDTASDQEGAPNLCTNPACGVANPPGERNCQRCGTPLPMAAGTLLHGRYRIERQLAVGGFGAVYLSTDTKENRPVAVKEMICPDPQEFVIRLTFFRRESEILDSLKSIPIVPRVYDYFEDEKAKTAHLVLEFIKGKDLLKIMESNGNKPFPLAQVVDWGRSICDVLSHMHSQSPPLVHRDLKPDNIMLLDDGPGIKMIDFGTARDVGRTQKERLAAKTRVYTEGYAPPEQIIGKPEPRSDLFALAGTLYHLATGKAPEGFYTAQEIEKQLKEGNGAIPADGRWFFELIRINLAEDANDRYFSAREFKADLEKRQVTREVSCGKCQATNRVREPYCTKCAEPLTDPTPPCHYCGKTNRMGSRCCIHCGNRLR
jgi:hypothetical protein